MAVVQIGGVLVSTFLTLFVVPCVYTFLTSKHRRTSYVKEIEQALTPVGLYPAAAQQPSALYGPETRTDTGPERRTGSEG